MYEYFEIQKDKKKSLTAAEKKKSVHVSTGGTVPLILPSIGSKRKGTSWRKHTSMQRLMAERKRLVTSESNLLDYSEDEVNTRRKVVSRSVLRLVNYSIATDSRENSTGSGQRTSSSTSVRMPPFPFPTSQENGRRYVTCRSLLEACLDLSCRYNTTTL